jgi:succinoglycan biosynthesis transport protein ExoP
LAAAVLVGSVAGLAAAFAREHLNAVFLSPSQIKKELGTTCLGVFPALPDQSRRSRREQRGIDTKGTHALPENGSPVRDGDARVITRDPERYTRAVDDPFSTWSEAIRFLAADILDASRPAAVIGVCSALPGEGKSMAAANLAELIADAGRKVLLVDCDLRNAALTRKLTPGAMEGLPEAIATPSAPLGALVWRDPVTGLDFLPAPLPFVRSTHPSGALSSKPMQELLASAQNYYDYVILDLPPITPVADVKAVSHFMESFILVIEWGRTAQSVVLDALNSAPLVGEKLMGAVLNKANPSMLESLESYKARYRR